MMFEFVKELEIKLFDLMKKNVSYFMKELYKSQIIRKMNG